jgi:hypothetical protein
LLLPLCVLDLKSCLSESIKPDFWGRTKAFPACFLSSYAATVFSDISCIVMFNWFEPVLYLDPVAKFPETTEKDNPGFYVGFADNVGDVLTFKILKNDLSAVLHRSVFRSAADPMRRNKRVTFKPDTQEVLEKIDSIPGATIHNNNQPKQRSRKSNVDVSNRTRSKAGNMNQNIGDRVRSKKQLIQKSGFQGNIFPLYDEVKFQDKNKKQKQEVDL